MSITDFNKTQRKHLRCVSCGKTFGSVFDEKISAYPVFHPSGIDPGCELNVFEELLRIYRFIREKEKSISMKQILKEFPWLGKIVMKKEMVHWCLRLGYLSVDNFGRIDIPAPIKNACMETFAEANLDDPENKEAAINVLQAALSCFKGDLKPVPEDRIPMNKMEIPDLGPSALFGKIDTSNVQLRSDRAGMVTAGSTGAMEIDMRVSSASNSRERNRLKSRSPIFYS